MTREELVENLDSKLYKRLWEIDIDILSIRGTELGVFIIGTCFIDVMAGFRYGAKKEDYRKGKERFKKFIGEYLSQYDPDKLYGDLRSGLIHSHVVDNFGLTSSGKGNHLIVTKEGKTVIDKMTFVSEIKEAYKRLKDDILSKPDVFENAEKRYESLGLMEVKPIQIEFNPTMVGLDNIHRIADQGGLVKPLEESLKEPL